MIHAVRYKRELRTHDHRPLVEAARRGSRRRRGRSRMAKGPQLELPVDQD